MGAHISTHVCVYVCIYDRLSVIYFVQLVSQKRYL